MFSLIESLINYTGSSYNYDSYIFYICGAIVVILTVVFIDLVYRLFRSILKIS